MRIAVLERHLPVAVVTRFRFRVNLRRLHRSTVDRIVEIQRLQRRVVVRTPPDHPTDLNKVPNRTVQ